MERCDDYKGGLTREQFLFYEIRVVAKLINEGLSRQEATERIIGENLFQFPTERMITSIANTCFNRIEVLNSASLVNDKKNPVFVKNLENVQGDERDVIIFSICYGPDEKGHVSNNFGPINKDGGGKRLNVAFSRSRIEMIIYTSMHSSDIKVKNDSSDGIKAFYSFMKYAEGGELKAADGLARERFDLSKAGILQSVCKALDDHGYKYETMMGKSDFRVDIAIVDPYDESKFMLGVLLDGDGYRMIKNTRDREIAQPEILQRLGWKLCRIWTIDWLDNREKEINKLLDLVNSLSNISKEEFERKQAEEEARQETEHQKESFAVQLREEIERQAQEVLKESEEDIRKRLDD